MKSPDKKIFKIIAGLLMVTFLMAPLREAQAVVLNFETNPAVWKSLFDLRLQSLGTPGDYTGMTSLDNIAYTIAKLLLRALTNSLVTWIRTGGIRGGPLIVTDFGEHFRRELENATGVFLEEVTSRQFMQSVCSPFRVQLGVLLDTSLLRTRSFGQRARCTINDIVRNVENFRVDFTYGGWTGWMSLLEPNNNLIGSYLISMDEAQRRQQEANARAHYELTSSGVLADKKCQETPGRYLVACTIRTASKTVADALGVVITDPVLRLQLADSVNEIVAAALDELVSWAITGGGGFTNYRPAPSDVVGPGVSITSPFYRDPVSGTTTVAAAATDISGVAGVQFLLDGRNLGPEDALPPYETSWNTTLTPNGPHSLSARARDNFGNTNTSLVIEVIVSNATSTATSTAP